MWPSTASCTKLKALDVRFFRDYLEAESVLLNNDDDCRDDAQLERWCQRRRRDVDRAGGSADCIKPVACVFSAA